MKNIIEKLKLNRLQDFKGAHIKVNLPLPEPLINEFIAESLQGDSIRQLRLQVLPDNDIQVDVQASVKLLFRAKLSRTIMLRLENELSVDDQFQTMAGIERIEGGFGKAEEAVIQLLSKMINKDLPHYVKFSGEEIKVNAYQLLLDYGFEFAVDYIDKLYVSTEVTGGDAPNRIWISGEMNIRESTVDSQ